MSYRVKIQPSVARKIQSWGLSDYLLVETYLQLREVLPANLDLLQRRRHPFDGMVFPFSVVDPENRLCEHFCLFHVLFHQDEQTLLVVNAAYRRVVGM